MPTLPLRRIVAQPATHIAIGVPFVIMFVWPIFAMTKPAHTVIFLHVAWALSMVALFAISRRPDSVEVEEEDEVEETQALDTGDTANGGRS